MSSIKSEIRASVGDVARTVALRVFITLGLSLICLPLFSQANFGRILGTVTDQSGGAMANASVTVTDTQRGVSRTLTTDDAGEYNAPTLLPGSYTVRAEAKGFKTLARENVVLEVGKEIRVDLTLQPGEQTQTVTVTESVPLVDASTATLGGTLSNSDINDLPLNGRNYQSLLALRPGVMLQPGGGPWTQSTNGVRPDESAWMVDGVINANFFDSRPIAGMPSPITDGATILPIDAIQEFNLEENPKAEYGWKPGAVVNVGIKSGTNTLHGSAYAFGRDGAWDARNYFNPPPAADGSCPLTSCDKLPTQLKQFGAAVGGPILKDKLFFFGAYEGLRSFIGNSLGTNGIPETISQASNPPAKPTCPPTIIGDCQNSMVDALWAASKAGAVSPVSLALTGCTLGATQASTTCTGGFFPSNPSGNIGYVSNFPNTNRSDNGVGKLDYHINGKNTLNGLLVVGNYLGDGMDHPFINKIFLDSFIIKTYTASGSWIWTPSSSLVNELRFGYNRMSFITGTDDAGIKSPVNTGLSVPGFPIVNIGSFNQLGTWHNRPQSIAPNPYYDLQDSVSYLKGKHALKFGGEFAHIEADSNIPDYGRGQIKFNNLTTFFEGIPSGGKVLIGNPSRKMTWTSTAGFVQDDWRLTTKVTLNLGLRYEYKSPLKEASNLWANFDPNSPTGLVQQGQGGVGTIWKPDHRDFSPRVGFAYDVTGRGTTVVRGGFGIMYSSFTAVMWMNQNQFQNNSSVSLAANPSGADLVVNGVATPGGGTIQVKAASTTPSPANWNSVVFPPATGNLQCGDGATVGGVKDPGPCNLMAVDPNLRTPYVINYDLGVQHAFASNLSLEVGYVGNHGSRLTGFRDINQPDLTTGISPYAAKFPYFGFINQMSNDVRSNYNSMQATLTKRMSQGLSFIAGYTFAHGLDNGSLNRFALIPQNSNDVAAEYGNSDFDVRHRFTFTTTYNLPGRRVLASCWKAGSSTPSSPFRAPSRGPWTTTMPMGPLVSAEPGIALIDGISSGILLISRALRFPSLTALVLAALSLARKQVARPGSPPCFLIPPPWRRMCTAKAPDPTTLAAGGCFVSGNSVMVPPVAGTFGTMGRNIFRDSGFKNVDFSIFKNFTFKERFGVQFRAEFFNLFNRPIFANPYGASSGTSGGQNDPSTPSGFGGTPGTPDVNAGNPIVGSGSARDVQLGLKLTF